LIYSSAASGASVDDIVQSMPTCAIDPRVEEPKWRQSCRQPSIIKKSNYRGEGRRRSRSTTDLEVKLCRSTILVDNMEPDALCGNIGESPAVGVVQALPCVTKVAEELFNCIFLIFWAWEEVAKASRGERCSELGFDISGRTYGCYIWTSSREYGQEACCILPVIRLACTGNASITRAKNLKRVSCGRGRPRVKRTSRTTYYGHASSTQLTEHAANLLCIGCGN
jgi:hypothetical protein